MRSQLPDAPTPQPVTPTARPGLFPMTQWSMISAARGSDDGRVDDGLRGLAIAYWRPLYLYLRKRGESHEDASDSVQGFFEFVFSSGFLAHVGREGGKFRSYLLRSLERWRSQRRTYLGAQKRGGQVEHVHLDGVEEFREVAEASGVGAIRSPRSLGSTPPASPALARAGASKSGRPISPSSNCSPARSPTANSRPKNTAASASASPLRQR